MLCALSVCVFLCVSDCVCLWFCVNVRFVTARFCLCVFIAVATTVAVAVVCCLWLWLVACGLWLWLAVVGLWLWLLAVDGGLWLLFVCVFIPIWYGIVAIKGECEY